jgi:20S proteasome alpha/beta subunit
MLIKLWRIPGKDRVHVNDGCLYRFYRTAIGLRVKDGVVLAVEKLVHSKLLVPGANRRIQTIDKHIGLVRGHTNCIYCIHTLGVGQATAGLLADGRHVSNRARDEAASHREVYRSPPTLKVCNSLGVVFLDEGVFFS